MKTPALPLHVKVRGPYSPRRRVSVDCSASAANPGRTKQSFRDECDINVLMRRYQETGVLDFVQKREPQYGDVTGVDFRESMELVAEASEAFNELPSSLRDRFQNDPAKFLDFVSDKKNLPEMGELGLLSPEAMKRLADEKTAAAAAAAAAAVKAHEASKGSEPGSKK